MLKIEIFNTTEEGANKDAKYRYFVYVNKFELATGEISSHDRDDGWAALLIDMATHHLTKRAADVTYCPHCGELMSSHVISERGGFCEPSRG